MLQALTRLFALLGKFFSLIFVKSPTPPTPGPVPPPAPVPPPIPPPPVPPPPVPTPTPPPPTPPPPPPSPTFEARLAAFVAKYNGQRMQAPGGIGGQCVDLVDIYVMEVFGFPKVWRNAIDWFGYDPARYAWVSNDPNDPNQLPPKGAIMVWHIGGGIPIEGHNDVVINVAVNGFDGFDQNWPVGSPAHVQRHNWAYIQGWGIPVGPDGKSLLT